MAESEIAGTFTTILGDEAITIDDTSNPTGWITSFGTFGRVSGSPGFDTAYLTFMVQGMTKTVQDAVVTVNELEVGRLANSNGGNDLHWNTQIITVSGSTLKSGTNTLHVFPVDAISPKPGDTRDGFKVRGVNCHYHTMVAKG